MVIVDIVDKKIHNIILKRSVKQNTHKMELWAEYYYQEDNSKYMNYKYI